MDRGGRWIRDICVEAYDRNNTKRLQGRYWINAVILNTNASNFVSKMIDNIPNIIKVKESVQSMYKFENFKFQMKDKESFCERVGYSD